VIFHLAAQASVAVSVARPVYDAAVNVLGTIRVLEAAREAKIRKIVYAASGGSLYGEPDPADLPLAEHAPHGPLSPYGVSKKAAIDYMVAYRALHGTEFTALALANVYGPRQDPHGEAGVVAIFTANLLAGKTCVINGDGRHTVTTSTSTTSSTRSHAPPSAAVVWSSTSAPASRLPTPSSTSTSRRLSAHPRRHGTGRSAPATYAGVPSIPIEPVSTSAGSPGPPRLRVSSESSPPVGRDRHERTVVTAET